MIKIREINSVLSLVAPLMAAFLAQKCMQLIDTLMLGWIGPDALAAGALGTSIFFTTIVFCMGTLSSVGVFISQAKGANNTNDIKSNMQHGLFLSLLLSVPCMLIVWFSPYCLTFAGESRHVVDNVILLIHGLVWGIPGYLLFLTMREFISAFSLTRVIMAVTLLSIPLTFISNYVLIYGKYHFPQLGIAGVGYAGAGIMWFMFLCLIIYSKKSKLLRTYISFDFTSCNYQKIIDMLYIGVPSGTLFVLESGMFVSAVIMMGYFGVDHLAAYQIAMQCASIAYSIPFSLSMATTLLVGHAVGSEDRIAVKRSIILCLGIALLFSSIVAIIFLVTPTSLTKIFLNSGDENNNEIIRLSTSFLAIAAFFQCIDAIQAIANGALRGMKDTLMPMIISIGCYWLLGISCAYYFSFHTFLKANGIWYGLTLGIFSAGTILMMRLSMKLRIV